VKAVLRATVLLGIATALLAGALLHRSPAPSDEYPAGRVLVEASTGGVRVTDVRSGVMGTLFGVEVHAGDEGTGRRACSVAYHRIAALEARLSHWREDSLLSRVNREAASRPVTVDADTFWLLESARYFHRISAGTFDPSIGPLLGLFKPFARLEAMPPDGEIALARALVGFDRVLLDPLTRAVRFAAPGMSIDLGAIAKGYAADEAVRVARSEGALACRVNAGGDMVAGGAPPGRPEGFETEIRDPRGDPAATLPGRTFDLRDRAAATSGNYERTTEIAGKRYSHILDPRTGRPVPDAVTQVTVMAPTGLEADALATALVVLGPESGLRLAQELPNVEALFLLPDGDGFRSVATTGFPGGRR
jgi:thiamine biosynthesis lipoprotein